jgi:hypothetical protein
MVIVILICLVAASYYQLYQLEKKRQESHEKMMQHVLEYNPNKLENIILEIDWRRPFEYKFIPADRNNDGYEDSISYYAADDLISQASYDNNYNGIYEVQRNYNVQGKCTGLYEDKDEDGFFEYYTKVRDGQSTTWFDVNGDGFYSTDEVVAK